MGYNRGLKFGTVFTILIVLVAIYYRSSEDILQKRLQALIYGLEKLENKHVMTSRPTVAIGYGMCTDVYVNAKELLNYSEQVGRPQHFNEINTELELLKSFAYYFRHGAAAERYMANRTLFDELVAKARSFPSSYSTIGGNAAIMALRFAREGCDVTLAAKLTRSLHQMMPQVINIVGGELKRDDIHLVIEYKHGDVWGPYSSARANRYIIHNDVNNPKISSLDAFDKLLSTYQPNLLVISGLQMMDNYPFPNVANSTPRIATVLDQMRTLFKLLRIRNKTINNSREVTRMHVHTLAYQAILTVKGSMWKNTMAAAAKASLTAHRHVCATSHIDIKKAALILDDSFSTSLVDGTRIALNTDKPVSCWEEILKIENKDISIQVCVAPVLVCTEAAQTAGGGDNISSAGLVLQI
ncbi:PREDICTED: ADP-dependent glucokinase isoform X2 [Eufriesea mexicana]|uniref:ADP-dependent glucokinase isoform X2 n=1 Tax=Eufriesea mexicana TaxID=516756 RepID=UPI00083C3817|nr:PREDICTED: ADP-dependent glucokinase isoform X2 [Eufriesea mexicana]